jgi:hypothetical protein
VRGETPVIQRLNAKGIFFVPAVFAFLAGTYLPLAFIALGAVYAYDLFRGEGLLPPHRWLFWRLSRWFGGDR